MAIPYLTDIDPAYSHLVELSPLVRRMVCNNPGRFTFTGTGTYVVGVGEVAVIDPGPADEDHLAALLAALAGEDITQIVITHTHRDHSPGAAYLHSATGATTYGFGPHPVPDEDDVAAATPSTWDSLMPTPEELDELAKSMPSPARDKPDHSDQEEPGDMGFVPDVELGHGELIKGGTFTLQALHTPGHISNHLCYGLPEEQALFTGDHVMGWSTTVIPPPDGNMGAYMNSLELLLDRDDRVYYPTHGPPVPDPVVFTKALIEHRHQRARQILAALASGPKSIPDLVSTMYVETPHILHMAAGQSVMSHLYQLVDDGAVSSDGAPGADVVYSLT